MRVAVDGRAFTSPAGGVRRYVTELFGALYTVAPDVVVTAIGASDTQTLPHGVQRAAAGPTLPTNLGWAMTGLPRAVARGSFDLFHAPAYTAPLWSARPLLLTIHDVSYARHPEWYPSRIDPARQWFYRKSARRADRIITDSEFSRAELVAAYGIDAERIDVIPLGVSADFRPDPAMARRPMALHVGDLHVRRNLDMILDVVVDLRSRERTAADLCLVLVGKDRGVLSSLLRRANDAGHAEAVRHVDSADDRALVSFYRQASMLVYPSRYEGFGLPVIEAMACGTPVVAAASSSLPEVVADAGLLIDPVDAGAWRAAMLSILTNEYLRDDLSERGKIRAATLTWQATARQTLASYLKATARTQRAAGVSRSRRSARAIRRT